MFFIYLKEGKKQDSNFFVYRNRVVRTIHTIFYSLVSWNLAYLGSLRHAWQWYFRWALLWLELLKLSLSMNLTDTEGTEGKENGKRAQERQVTTIELWDNMKEGERMKLWMKKKLIWYTMFKITLEIKVLTATVHRPTLDSIKRACCWTVQLGKPSVK